MFFLAHAFEPIPIKHRLNRDGTSENFEEHTTIREGLDIHFQSAKSSNSLKSSMTIANNR